MSGSILKPYPIVGETIANENGSALNINPRYDWLTPFDADSEGKNGADIEYHIPITVSIIQNKIIVGLVKDICLV